MKEKVTREGGIRSRLENFFYHYKWHTVVALFVVAAIVICSVQMCSREKFDNYVLYAGGHGISRAGDGDVPEYNLCLSSFGRITEDLDGDGAKNPSFLDLYIPSPDEMKESGSDLYSLTAENARRLEYELVSGTDYFLCLLSPYNYEQYLEWDGVPIFTPIAGYVPEGASVETVGEYAIRLSSLPFYALDGIRELPEDTLVCLRRLNSFAEHFDGKNRESFEQGEAMLRRMLAYGL